MKLQYSKQAELLKKFTGNDFCFSCITESSKFSLPVVQAVKATWASVKNGLSNPHPILKESRKLFRAFAGKNADLLTDEAGNAKIAKGSKAIPEYMTVSVSLSPAKSGETGLNFCPCATKECEAICLAETGRADMSEVITPARKKRSQFLVQHPQHFITVLNHEIHLAKGRAAAQGKKLAVRLNAFSDLVWEQYAPQLFKDHSDVQFYDYTKIASRTKKEMPPNYHLTLSSTGIQGKENNWNEVRQHLDNGGIVAMVFDAKPGRGGKGAEKLPTTLRDKQTGKEYLIFNGDDYDNRHLDALVQGLAPGQGAIAGLHLKSPNSVGFEKQVAKAKNFVVHYDSDIVEVG